MNEAPIPDLKHAVESQHGGTAIFVQSVPIHEERNGQTLWDGTVAVFDLAGHPKATRAYAWSYELSDGKRRFFAVLHLVPIMSPRDAVRAAILVEQRKGEPTTKALRKAARRIENDAYAKEARFWRDAKSALSLDSHGRGVNQQARGVFTKKPKKS